MQTRARAVRWVGILVVLAVGAAALNADPSPAHSLPKVALVTRTNASAPRDHGVAEVRGADEIFRVGPGDDYDRRTPLAQGVRLAVVGRSGDWLQADLGGGDRGWVQEEGVRWLPSSAKPPDAAIRNVLIRAQGGETWVDVQTTGRIAFDVIEDAASPTITLRLHNATMMMNELAQVAGDPLVHRAALRQSAPGQVDLVLHLNHGFLWGWSAAYVASPNLAGDPPGHDFQALAPATLRLALRWPPALDAGSLQGVTVVVDPGHGGPDSGAIGLHGLKEKDANLKVALAFRDALEQAGARVVMTRDRDRAVAAGKEDELEQRVQIARQAGGTIFISIHHNARPKVSDGRVARGTYVYYYQPQSADLAAALMDPVAKAVGEEHRAYVWRSFHVIRQPYMPAVLVEVTFISNPEMEAKMTDPDYAAHVAEGLVEGVKAFFAGRCAK